MTINSTPHKLGSIQWDNKRVGILGGSFNPAHAGHLHISKIALKKLDLDMVWWIITPQNPLKPEITPLPMSERLYLANNVINNHPQILATNIEEHYGTKYSDELIKKLKTDYPKTNFAWITGMDNAYNFHLWHNWKDILNNICVVHIARNYDVMPMKQSYIDMVSNHFNIYLNNTKNSTKKVDLDINTTYWLLNEPTLDISSTNIRNNNQYKTDT